MINETISSERQDTADIFRRLRWLQKSFGRNRNEQAAMLIQACIVEGINTRPRIVAALQALGMNRGHVCIILNNELKAANPEQRWSVSSSGIYAVPEPTSAANKAQSA